MTLAAPHVYIGTVRMDDYALAETPMLAGLSFSWGTESQVDFDDPHTLSAQLLVRTPSTLDFLTKGAPFGLIDPGTGGTIFAGRIATLKARPDKRKKDALLITLTAADTLTELAQYRVEEIEWLAADAFATSAATRRAQIAAKMPAGWTLESTTTSYDWTTARPQRFKAEPLLPVLDAHLRSTIGRRHNTSRYIPGTGLAPRITIANERATTAPSETLATRADATWYMSTAAPANTAFIALAGNQVDADIEWEKTPDDTITAVNLDSLGLGWAYNPETQTVEPEEKSDSDYRIWPSYHPGDHVANAAALQASHGIHELDLEVDTLGGSNTSPHVGFIINYWLDADAQWRPTALTVPDSRKLADATVLGMLDVTRRYNAYATVTGLPANNPAGGSRVRAYIIAGEAEWTGKKWVLTLTLGRVPRPGAAAGVLTFDSIRTHPDTNIANGTAETIGTELSFADFAYIGA